MAQTVPRYASYWPFWTLLIAYGVAAAWKVVADPENATSRRFLATLTAGSLKELQAVVLDQQDHDSLRLVQSAILSILVDKARELLAEEREDQLSANLMVADEDKRTLSLVVFSRFSLGREKIEVPFDAPGAGRAITTMQPIYIKDSRSDDMHQHFRPNAPYRSILSIPIACNDAKLGVVNLDSPVPDHFQLELLIDHLQPYVQLIGLSICMDRRLPVSNERGQ